jgi:hypothetical protein
MTRVLAIGPLLFALTGCGTGQNLKCGVFAGATPYGGVEIAVDRYKSTPHNGDFTRLDVPQALRAADVALSAVGDTLTLPITGSVAVWRAGQALRTFYHAEDNSATVPNAWREFWFNDQPSRPAPPAPSP